MIRDYAGDGAYGPVYGDPRTVKANVQPTFQFMEEGPQMQSWVVILIVIRPEDGPVKLESEVEHLGVAYRVTHAYPIPDSYRPDHWELRAGRFVQRA